MFSSLLDTGDRFLLQLFRNSSEVALYDAAYRLAKYPLTLVGSSFMLAAYPIFVKTWDTHGKTRTEADVSKLIRYILILMIPIVVGISYFSKDIVSLFLDELFEPGYITMPFVSIGVLFVLLSQYSTMVFMLLQKTTLYALTNLCGVIINLLLNFWLINKFGFLGAGISTAISYAIFFVITKILTRNHLNWHVPLTTLAKIGIAIIAMITFLIFGKQYVDMSNFFAIAGFCLISFFIYCIVLFLTKEIKPEEIKLILGPMFRS